MASTKDPRKTLQEPDEPADGNVPNQSGGGGGGGGTIEPTRSDDKKSGG
jgi:hypothetical protein